MNKKMDKKIKESKLLKKYDEFNIGIVCALILFIGGLLRVSISIQLFLLSLVALVDLMVAVITNKKKEMIMDICATVLLWIGAVFLK